MKWDVTYEWDSDSGFYEAQAVSQTLNSNTDKPYSCSAQGSTEEEVKANIRTEIDQMELVRIPEDSAEKAKVKPEPATIKAETLGD